MMAKRSGDDLNSISDFHIYITINAIISYTKTYSPTRVFIVWDARKSDKSNSRKDIYGEYKGNRSSDTSPHQNNDVIQSLLEKLGIKNIFPYNLEADDIVAYLCSTPGENVIISVDKDFIQLVSPNTVMFDPIRKKEYNIKNFEQLTGCKNVEQWLHEKCLLGDKSDNVPGAVTKSKVKRLNEGTYTLTEEEQQIYERNMQLFSLYHDMESKQQDIDFYKDQINEDCKTDWQGFVNECNERSFESLLKKKSDIYSLFFLKSKLLSFFAQE